jgi:hypothetical protein
MTWLVTKSVRSRHHVHYVATAFTAAAIAIASCGPSGTAVAGQIDDAEIRVDAAIAAKNSTFEFTNVGANPCDLVVIVTDLAADALPLSAGQVDLDALGGRSNVDSVDSAVQPGSVARWTEQLPAEAGGDLGVRVILCNGLGDYEAGRYTILPITPDLP